MNQWKNFTNGFLKESPTFVIILGMCPTLGTSTSAINGVSMGLATTFVLVMSNIMISLVKNFIPDKVRIPSFIVIIASFVIVVELVMKAFVPEIFETLGIFIPLIVVNCIVLGRAEAFAQKNTVLSSAIDGLGMGLGFSMALFILGSIREILGAGSILGYKFIAGDGILVFILAPGAFLALGYLIMIMNRLKKKIYNE
jgi:Na+-translocating ferredoxin:NAD+ oxidoreductase subunit E